MGTASQAPFHGQFYGWIAGVGTRSGTRLVLGHWTRTPFGRFSDVMVAHPDGRRELLAPSREIADFVASTYRFEQITVCPVEVRRHDTIWHVVAGPLDWTFAQAQQHRLGRWLDVVPLSIARTATFARLTNPVAARVLPGVRTIGQADSAQAGRTEWYAGRDLHHITLSLATWNGASLGLLGPVTPAPDFGFSSTPAEPSIARVVSTVSDR